MNTLLQLLVVLAVLSVCVQSYRYGSTMKTNFNRLRMSDKSPLPGFESIVTPPKPASPIAVMEDNTVNDRTTLDSALDFLEENATNEAADEYDLFEIYEDSPDIEIPYDLIAKLEQDEINAQINKKPSLASQNEAAIKNAIQKWKLHEKDSGSAEVQIVTLSEKVQYLTRHLLKNNKDVAAKRGLTAIVNQRRKLLNYLYESDRSKADSLIEELGIRFKPPGRLWDKEAKYGAFKNTKSPAAKKRTVA